MHVLFSNTIASRVIIYSNTTQLFQLISTLQTSYTLPFVEIKTGSSNIISNEFFTFLKYFFFFSPMLAFEPLGEY